MTTDDKLWAAWVNADVPTQAAFLRRAGLQHTRRQSPQQALDAAALAFCKNARKDPLLDIADIIACALEEYPGARRATLESALAGNNRKLHTLAARIGSGHDDEADET